MTFGSYISLILIDMKRMLTTLGEATGSLNRGFAHWHPFPEGRCRSSEIHD